MGLAIDTIAGSITGTQSSLTGITLASGDSLTIRNFGPNAYARLEAIYYQATTTGSIQVKSPMFCDDVRGIQFTPAESPSRFLLPAEIGQPLVSQDTLSLQLSGGGSGETDVVALSVYYSDLSGTSARLVNWSDISSIIKNVKPLEVDVSTPTAGTWSDTVITTTENLLHANQDYAVLGFVTDTEAAAIGVKGQETGNLRITGAGSTATNVTSNYFVNMSEMHKTPHIPVFNSANKDSFYVSVMQATTVGALKVQLILAELAHNI